MVVFCVVSALSFSTTIAGPLGVINTANVLATIHYLEDIISASGCFVTEVNSKRWRSLSMDKTQNASSSVNPPSLLCS